MFLGFEFPRGLRTLSLGSHDWVPHKSLEIHPFLSLCRRVAFSKSSSRLARGFPAPLTWPLFGKSKRSLQADLWLWTQSTRAGGVHQPPTHVSKIFRSFANLLTDRIQKLCHSTLITFSFRLPSLPSTGTPLFLRSSGTFVGEDQIAAQSYSGRRERKWDVKIVGDWYSRWLFFCRSRLHSSKHVFTHGYLRTNANENRWFVSKSLPHSPRYRNHITHWMVRSGWSDLHFHWKERSVMLLDRVISAFIGWSDFAFIGCNGRSLLWLDEVDGSSDGFSSPSVPPMGLLAQVVKSAILSSHISGVKP